MVPTPEIYLLSAKDQFRIARLAGDQIAQIIDNTRPSGERKRGVNDERIPFKEAKNKRDAIVEFIGSLRLGMGCLTIEWALDKNLGEQVRADVDPIQFRNSEPDYSLEAYADMLALAARATNRHTQGTFDGVSLSARPAEITQQIELKYLVAKAAQKND